MILMARILIVDDSTMMRKTLRTILQQAGHTIDGEAANGEQALALYARCRPELVTLDITMPGMSGLEVIKKIRQLDENANIIVVSALGQQHIVFEALQSGARNFVSKPIIEDKVLAVVDIVLDQGRNSSTSA
jgi:Response regulator containing CheY-like receiver, AAA-type ATPase, and DNA-binding domains